jgi:dihydroneopterin aldolase
LQQNLTLKKQRDEGNGLGKIRINNMRFYTFNGVLEEEQVLGQNIEIDIQLETPFDAPSADDDLEKTINYAEVYTLIKNYVENHSFKLMETLAQRLLEEICEKYQEKLTHILLRVRKYHVPISGIFDNIEIEVERSLEK